MALASPCAGLNARSLPDLKCQPVCSFGSQAPGLCTALTASAISRGRTVPCVHQRPLPLHCWTGYVFFHLVMTEMLDPKSFRAYLFVHSCWVYPGTLLTDTARNRVVIPIQRKRNSPMFWISVETDSSEKCYGHHKPARLKK